MKTLPNPRLLAIAVVTVFLSIADTGVGAPSDQGNLASDLAPLRSYDYGQNRTVPDILDRLVRDSSADREQRIRLEAEFDKLLGSEISLAAKQEICRRLAIIGTDQSLPALAAMLRADQAPVAEAACYALRGNSSEAATAALRQALGTAHGTGLAAVVSLLGDRRDAASGPILGTLARQGANPVKQAAIDAIGEIATAPCVDALKALRKTPEVQTQMAADLALLQAARELAARGQAAEARAIDQQLTTGSPLVRRSALLGLVELGGPDTAELISSVLAKEETPVKAAVVASLARTKDLRLVQTFAGRMAALPIQEQVLLAGALAHFKEAFVPEALEKLAQSPDLPARIAALQALQTAGAASSVPLLVGKAASPATDEAKAAVNALRVINGPGVDQAVRESILGGAPEIQAQLIPVLADRKDAAAVPELLRTAGQTNEVVARASFQALGTLGREQDFPEMLRLLGKASAASVQSDAEAALVQIINRATNPDSHIDSVLTALESAQDIALKASLIRVVGAIGNNRAYEALANTARGSDARMKDVAVRALSEWSDSRPLPLLLEVAKSNAPELLRTIALRGYLRLLREAALPNDEALQGYAEALKLAGMEEKRTVLSGLGTVHNVRALRMAEDLLDEAPVRAEAESTVLALAKQLGPTDRSEVNTALQKIIRSTDQSERRKEAETLLRTP